MKNDWTERVRLLLREEWQIGPEERLLLAVSGGRDSCVLLHLMLQLGQSCALAHVNYGLRGAASDRDEDFVRRLAESSGLPFHLHRANPNDFQSNLQAKARALRYRWFEELCAAQSYAAVVTAHHQQDQAETVLMAMFRGRGSRAAAGMQAKSGQRLRPLLEVSAAELAAYAAANSLQWVEDSSNATSTYDRNYLRNEVKPLLDARFPGWDGLVARQARHAQQFQALLDEKIAYYHPLVVEEREHDWHFWTLAPLAGLLYADLLLGAFAAAYALQQHEREALVALQHLPRGKALDTPEWLVWRTAEGFAWQRKSAETSPVQLLIPAPGSYVFPRGTIDLTEGTEFSDAWELFDADLLKFPLVLRQWQPGDRLQPQGMRGSKKLSDLFNTHQMSPYQKQKQLLLCDAEHILWVVGLRRSIFAPVTAQTKRLLAIKLVYD